MNIFVLDEDPRAAARALCDKHVPQMLLESVQLLSNSHRLNGSHKAHLAYRVTHENSPATRWVCGNASRYHWLLRHALEINEEYMKRYGKWHDSAFVLEDLGHPPVMQDVGSLEPWVQLMPDEYLTPGRDLHSTVEAYRAYYKAEKASFARWERGTPPPSWWPRDRSLE